MSSDEEPKRLSDKFVSFAEQRRYERSMHINMTDKQRALVAAVLGGTNCGLSNPTIEEVERLAQGNYSAESAAYSLWSKYAETQEMMDSFVEEIDSWYKITLCDMSASEVLKTWGKWHPELKPIFGDYK